MNKREMKTITLRKITYFWDIFWFYPILLDFTTSPNSYFKNACKANVIGF